MLSLNSVVAYASLSVLHSVQYWIIACCKANLYLYIVANVYFNFFGFINKPQNGSSHFRETKQYEMSLCTANAIRFFSFLKLQNIHTVFVKN